MSNPSRIRHCSSTVYRIRFQGHLAEHWSAWFDGMAVTPSADGTTSIEGALPDQAALYGLLGRMRDLGLTLLDLHRIEPADEPPAAE